MKMLRQFAESLWAVEIDVLDIIMWMKNKKGLFLVKLAYRVAMQVQRGEGWIENSSGCAGKQV